ncbi:hypothetical protein SCUCBS95973_003274 [Sporothrix curviconia]|uniref:Erythromycin esterase n=1 Tax=Sporothrix curviconia TaxID=1260050 RepID=A0ABP0BDV6_9PEZI
MAPLTRRRSARLASNSKPTGAASTPGLDSLSEQVEEQPSSPMLPPQTPAGSSPVRPSKSEMRPGKANGPKVPPSSALRLGFADIDTARQESPTTVKSNKIAASATLKVVSPEQDSQTPSKKPSALSAISPFTFRFSRLKGKTMTSASESTTVDEVVASSDSFASPKRAAGTPDLGLSDEARRMMEELREEAQKIRADLEVQREQERAQGEADDGANGGRRIAKPKSRAGRYSAAHTAEFDKMDSIANHPSAFRIAHFTPVKSTATSSSATTAAAAATPAIASQARGLKRTQSKANLDETPTSKPVARTPASVAVGMSTARKQFNPLFGADGKPPQSARKGNILFPSNDDERPRSAAKRIKQNIGDDTSSSRPMSRDGSSLPRPAQLSGSVSSLSRSHTTASLLTPTKASSLARSTSVKAPSNSGAANLLPPKTPNKSPSKSPLQLFSALKKSATTSSLQASVRTPPPPPAEAAGEKHTANKSKPLIRAADTIKPVAAASPSAPKVSFQANTSAARSVLPVPLTTAVMAFSKTPAPRMADRVVPPRFPATTPRRKLVKRVAFTPVTERAVLSEKSPSLFRSGIPRSALKSHARPQDSVMATDAAQDVGAGSSSGCDSPSVRRRFGATVFYPDLSGHELLSGPSCDTTEEKPSALPAASLAPPAPAPSVPGTFTFRSDKTINFGQTPPTGFGSSPGQASLRQVRPSTSAAPKIPGSFPGSSHVSDMFTALVPTDGPNKENTRPVAVGIIPHGITNKKRHRVSEADEAADEEAERAAKKRKNAAAVPEGEALLAPRLAGKTMPPSSARTAFSGVRSTPHKTSPQKSSPVKMTPHVSSTFSATSSPNKAPGSAMKKRPILTMSRLNSLARPKLRK